MSGRRIPEGAERDAMVREYAEKRGLSEERIRTLQDFLEKTAPVADPERQIPEPLQYKVFPIIALRRTSELPEGPVTGNPGFQGTATMLTHGGIFCTAAHCVNAAFGEKDITGQQAWNPGDYALWAVHYGKQAYKLCSVLEMCISETCDVAIGRAELPSKTSDFPDRMTIGTSQLGAGSAVFGIGYPNTLFEGEPGGALKISMNSRLNRGKIKTWRSDMVTWNQHRMAGYDHSVTTPPAFSGGPLIRKRTGFVHGIMTGGYVTFDSDDAPNIATDVRAFVDDWKIPFLGDVTLREYARKNPNELTIR